MPVLNAQALARAKTAAFDVVVAWFDIRQIAEIWFKVQGNA
jgi:hypothetical protein